MAASDYRLDATRAELCFFPLASVFKQKRQHRSLNTKEREADERNHETHVLEGDEVDINTCNKSCTKNPGHKQFVPAPEFTVNVLPANYRDEDLVKFIKSTADLTVRVRVKNTSEARPEFWPGTNNPYPFHENRGPDIVRQGTGIIWSVDDHTGNRFKETCAFRACRLSVTPRKVAGMLRMYTATHVVFDTGEAESAACQLFFDTKESAPVVVDNWNVVKADIDDDRCEMYSLICDPDLLVKLNRMVAHWREVSEKTNSKYRQGSKGGKFNFIVSHPHGCPKQISVGQWIEKTEVKDGWWTKNTYTTCTCPGSSGAYVYSLGCNHWLSSRHIHCGVNDFGQNYCGPGLD